MYVLDALIQLYTIGPGGNLLTQPSPRKCNQMEFWRGCILKDVWDFVDWKRELMRELTKKQPLKKKRLLKRRTQSNRADILFIFPFF